MVLQISTKLVLVSIAVLILAIVSSKRIRICLNQAKTKNVIPIPDLKNRTFSTFSNINQQRKTQRPDRHLDPDPALLKKNTISTHFALFAISHSKKDGCWQWIVPYRIFYLNIMNSTPCNTLSCSLIITLKWNFIDWLIAMEFWSNLLILMKEKKSWLFSVLCVPEHLVTKLLR